MDGFAIEAFLYSADFGEDDYLLASSSSDSESECCSCKTEGSTEKLKQKRPKALGFAEITVPRLTISKFKDSFRVNRDTCEKIAELLHKDFYSNHRGGWEKISPLKATYVLLWYLGSKETYKQIAERFNITQSCTHNIIKVACRSLSTKCRTFVKWPDQEQYEGESNAFYDICKIYGAIGAIVVSHFKILKPKNDHEKYVNVQNYHSIAMQGVVASNKKFVNLFLSEGSRQPAEILKSSSVTSFANNESFGEYFLLGNSAYSSRRWLITPFDSDVTLTARQKEFNQCLECGYRVAYDAFALLKDRFQRLNHFENKEVQFIKNAIQAACVLHNICIDQDDEFESFLQDQDIFDVKGDINDEDYDDTKRAEIINLFMENCKLE